MALDHILIEKSGHTAVLTINRPPANAWHSAAMKAFQAALDQVEQDRDIRVILLTGAGEKCFSAGFDVSAASADAGAGQAAAELGRILWRRVDRFPKPVVALINGHALGGGLELALACHFRIMADHPKAVLGLTELNLGIMPGWGGTQRLMQVVGRAKALDMILFARRLTPAQALETGLVNRVVAPEGLVKAGHKFAEELASRPPLAVSAVLRSMAAGIYDGVDQGLDLEAELSNSLIHTKDAMEGFAAFIEKRAPVFRGE